MAQTRPDNGQLTARPTGEERTGPQQDGAGLGVALHFSAEPGTGQVEPSTFATYRKMRRNPTIAMSRIVSTAPIKRAWFSVKGRHGVDDGRVEFIRDQLEQHWRHLVGQSLNALDYGYQSFETVWEVTEDQMWGIRKFKPLWPDNLEIMVDKDTGAYAGLKQGKVTLEPAETFRYSYDVEGTNWYGRSRHENVRETSWRWWMHTSEKMGKYGSKVAGVMPIIMYPEGQSKDSSGTKVDNFTAANKLLSRLGGDMKGIAMPNVFAQYARDMIERGVDLKQLRPWLFDFYEAKGQHGGDFVSMLQYHDKQLSRGWLTPERSFQEGVTGTKADAGVGADLTLQLADEMYADLVQCINWYVVDRLMLVNFPNAKPGDVYVETVPIIDEERALFGQVIEKLLAGPAIAELLPLLKLDDLVSGVGLPTIEEGEREPMGGEPIEPDTMTDPPEGGTDIGRDVQTSEDTVLNGAQIKSALDIVSAVANRELPRDAGVGMLEVMFNLSSQQAQKIMGDVGTSFFVATQDNSTPPAQPDAE